MGVFDLPEPDPLTDLERRYLDAENRGDYAEADRLAQLVDAPLQLRDNRLDDPGALAAAALWYAERRIPVFPVKPGLKAPLTRNGFHDATIATTQIRKWWERWPQANIGAPTGGLFDVIDVDGSQGLATWLQQDLEVDTIGHVVTPRGGGHHLYIKPRQMGNRSKKWKGNDMPGLDYRGSGGYVLLPPSRSAEAQRRYRWLKPLSVY